MAKLSESRSSLMETTIGRPAANVSFAVLRRYIRAMQRRGIGMLHTARPFSYYRKVFYQGHSAAFVLAQLRGKRVADIGCGYTPYNKDSMFRACHDAGIEFFGVDPLIDDQIKFGFRERLLARATGGSGQFERNPPGRDKAISCSAQDLPFKDDSVDEILCSYLLFVWLDDEEVLADVLQEFKRVLKMGGTAKIYPHYEWQYTRFSNARLLSVLDAFRVHQRLVTGRGDLRIGPSMLTILEKR